MNRLETLKRVTQQAWQVCSNCTFSNLKIENPITYLPDRYFGASSFYDMMSMLPKPDRRRCNVKQVDIVI